MTHPGEAAALAVSALWAVGSLLFRSATARIGALATNAVRLALAGIALTGLLAATGGRLPPRAGAGQVGLLALSGVVGLALGDGCYFRALLLVGPRQATLLAALAPVATAGLGLALLGERLGPRALAGMALALAGTAWVVLERTPRWPGARRTAAGTALGLAAAAGQAIGLVLSKAAMAGAGGAAPLDPLAAAVIRMWAAVAAMAVLLGAARAPLPLREIARPAVARVLLGATLVGPVAGMWLSLVAVVHTEAAVAATLMSLPPILMIPLVALVDRERPTARAVLGALLAVAGVALLVSRR